MCLCLISLSKRFVVLTVEALRRGCRRKVGEIIFLKTSKQGLKYEEHEKCFKVSLLYFFRILLIFLLFFTFFVQSFPDRRIHSIFHQNVVFVNILLVGIEYIAHVDTHHLAPTSCNVFWLWYLFFCFFCLKGQFTSKSKICSPSYS